jgi:hypothetical protein
VSWEGEAAAVEGLATTAGVALPQAAAAPGELAPLPADLLLELEGQSLDQLLQGLLSRDMIRQPLAARYGVDPKRLELLRRTPFRLRLRPQEQGPFRASLELQLPVGEQAAAWRAMFTSVTEALRREGLTTEAKPTAESTQESRQAPLPPERQGEEAAPAEPATAPPAATRKETSTAPMIWHRPDDGAVVGGWRWIGAGPSAEVLLFLGPPPLAPLPLGWRNRPPEPGLRLRVRSEALDRLGLLPAGIPPLVRRASQLWLETEPLGDPAAGAAISRLTGRLRLER